MRPFMLMISQRLHFSDIFARLERYGQLAIFLLGSGAIAYLYIILLGMLKNYLGGLELNQIPNY